MNENTRLPHIGRPILIKTLIFLIAVLLAFPSPALADSLSGTLKDPSGAVVVGAHIEISGPTLAQPLVFTSDSAGRFTAPDLKPGNYSVRVTKDGFEVLTVTVDLSGTADLPLNLVVAAQQTSVTVTGKSSGFANSDPKYRQLRDIGLGESFRCAIAGNATRQVNFILDARPKKVALNYYKDVLER